MSAQDVFTVIGDPTRRRILDELRAGERTVGQLTEALETAQPNVSKHLKQLGSVDLVQVRVDGPRRHYALRPERLEEVELWIAPFRRAWADRLDELEHHLDTMDDHKEQS